MNSGLPSARCRTSAATGSVTRAAPVRSFTRSIASSVDSGLRCRVVASPRRLPRGSADGSTIGRIVSTSSSGARPFGALAEPATMRPSRTNGRPRGRPSSGRVRSLSAKQSNEEVVRVVRPHGPAELRGDLIVLEVDREDRIEKRCKPRHRLVVGKGLEDDAATSGELGGGIDTEQALEYFPPRVVWSRCLDLGCQANQRAHPSRVRVANQLLDETRFADPWLAFEYDQASGATSWPRRPHGWRRQVRSYDRRSPSGDRSAAGRS